MIWKWLCPKISDQSISARGGIVTISHGENTLVRMNSTGDASVKIYLPGQLDNNSCRLQLLCAGRLDTNLLVHGWDHFARKNETSVLMFNLTEVGVSFEQSYTRKN